MLEITELPNSPQEMANLVINDSDKRVRYINPSTRQAIDVVRVNVPSLKCYEIQCWVDSDFFTVSNGLNSSEAFEHFVNVSRGEKTYQKGEWYTN